MAFKSKITSLLLALVIFVPAALWAGSLSGSVYHDADKSSRSHYEQEIGEGDAALADIDVFLFDGADETSAMTGDDGSFEFAGLEPGSYFIDYGLGSEYLCTSRNRPLRVQDAIREGAITIVTIGDSIGVEGSDHPYPECLADHFAELAEVTLHNQARGGSRSWEWLPGSDAAYFEERLLPVLADADLVTITLGGNDLDAYVDDGPPYDPMQIIQNFLDHPEYLLGMIPNVIELMEAIKAENPTCDVAYIVYPNFANSTAWQTLLPSFMHPLTVSVLDIALTGVRGIVGSVEDAVIVDMLGALYGVWLDDYLVDEVHPSDLGHQTYADLIFETLGGAVIDGEPDRIGQERMIGYFAPDLAPPTDDDVDDDADDDVDDDADDDLDDDIDDDTDDDMDDDDVDDDSLDDDSDDDADDDTVQPDQGGGGDDDDDGACCG
jgi:lysophospholipase L1-like esterase